MLRCSYLTLIRYPIIINFTIFAKKSRYVTSKK